MYSLLSARASESYRYPPRENDWVDYVSHVVEKYKDEIKVWRLWNELSPSREPPWNYTYYEKLLKATHDARATRLKEISENIISSSVSVKE